MTWSPDGVSVCLPALDEASTVGRIVTTIRSELMGPGGPVSEVVVVDDGSTDQTAGVARESGAVVVTSRGSAPGHPAGKGAAMAAGLEATTGAIVVYCDADVDDFSAHFVTRLLEPLSDPGVQMVKAFYRRPLGESPAGGGRVTELLARPLIRALLPHLQFVRQPLAGEIAVRRSALEQVEFEPGYAVDLALIIDLTDRYGVDALAQADLDVRHHRNRSLEQLSDQAEEILRMVLRRVGAGDVLENGRNGRTGQNGRTGLRAWG